MHTQEGVMGLDGGAAGGLEGPRTPPPASERGGRVKVGRHGGPAEAAWRREGATLATRLAAAERMAASASPSAATLGGNDAAAALQAGRAQAASAAAAEWAALRQRLAGARSAAGALAAHVARVQPGAAYLEALAGLMDEAERQIAGLKEVQFDAFEELVGEEVALTRELDAFEDRMRGWDAKRPAAGQVAAAAIPAAPPRVAWAAAPASAASQPPAVAEYDAFVVRTGALGGWDEQDHAMFKKLLRSVGGDYGAVVELALDAGFGREETIGHCRWDAEHEELLVRKRLAVRAWREQRDAERDTARAALEAATARDAEAQKEARSAARRDERARQAEQLREWKERQAEERARKARVAAAKKQLLAERAAKERDEKVKAAAEREARNAARRERLAAERAARAAEKEAAAQTPRPDPETARRNARERALLFKRDCELVAARNARTAAAKSGPEQRAARQATILQKEARPVAAKADSSRLLKPTAAATARRHAEEEDKPLFAAPMPRQRYTVPTWRQGV